MHKEHIRFIINPVSGYSRKDNIGALLKDNLDHSKYSFDVVYTERKGHATELTQSAIDSGVPIVVACGGDGTVNEVASAIAHSDAVLGIIPNGSGNGFAMHIGMGRNTKRAIKKLNDAIVQTIDTCSVNNQFFLNLAGIGFDALIAYKAESGTKRGLQMYLSMVSKEMIKFKAEDFTINVDGEVIKGPFTTIAVANAAMYGYHFTVAPLAKLTDGLFDVVFVKEASLLRTLGASWRLLNKSLYKSPLIEMRKAKNVRVSTNKKYFFHVDGESYSFHEPLEFKIHPGSIKVLFPSEN